MQPQTSTRFTKIRQSIWPVSVFGLGLLLLIIGVAGVANLGQTRHIYREIVSFEENYRRMENVLEDIRFETFRVALLLRDRWLLTADRDSRYAEELKDHRSRVAEMVNKLRTLRSPQGSTAVDRLDAALEKYFIFVANELVHPTVAPAGSNRDAILNNDATAHRARIFDIADEISRLNAENFDARRKALDTAVDRLQNDLWLNMITALFVGCCIAAGSVFRISELEQYFARQQQATREAEVRLRNLSQQLVSSQEQERKILSRELHDEIGQSLTALRIELGKLDRLRNSPEFAEHLEETKQLAEQTLQSARSISMGLRPAMLDELGLGPALQWQVREFNRRCQIPVDLELGSDLNDLPDQHRTYLYRIVQECLTNCARHAKANRVHVAVRQEAKEIHLTVNDDGKGFENKGKTGGLGLLGISERVRELNGDLTIDSVPGRGTNIQVRLPLAAHVVTS